MNRCVVLALLLLLPPLPVLVSPQSKAAADIAFDIALRVRAQRRGCPVSRRWCSSTTVAAYTSDTCGKDSTTCPPGKSAASSIVYGEQKALIQRTGATVRGRKSGAL